MLFIISVIVKNNPRSKIMNGDFNFIAIDLELLNQSSKNNLFTSR